MCAILFPLRSKAQSAPAGKPTAKPKRATACKAKAKQQLKPEVQPVCKARAKPTTKPKATAKSKAACSKKAKAKAACSKKAKAKAASSKESEAACTKKNKPASKAKAKAKCRATKKKELKQDANNVYSRMYHLMRRKGKSKDEAHHVFRSLKRIFPLCQNHQTSQIKVNTVRLSKFQNVFSSMF